MEAIKRQASKFREQVAKQQQVFFWNPSWLCILLYIFYVKFLIWSLLDKKDSIFIVTLFILGFNFGYWLFFLKW